MHPAGRAIERFQPPSGARALPGARLDLSVRPRAALTAAAAALSTILALALLLAHASTPPPLAAASQSAVPFTLLPRASSRIGASDRRYWPARAGGALVSESAQIHAAFSPAAASFTVKGDSLALSLAGAREAGRSLTLAETVRPGARANRVLYRYGALSEVYSNGPFGIEQGFTVERPLAGASSSTLKLDLSVAGSLSARQEGAQILFATSSGRTVLRYGDLSAVDAAGRSLPARMVLSGGEIALEIDTRGARYPLTIDPFIQTGEKVKPAGAAVQGAFGYSVALSAEGDTALIGAPKDGEVGAAFVFTRQGSTWTQQAELVPNITPKTKMGFGRSVALSGEGNMALIGASNAASNVGEAFIFTRAGSTWTQTEKLSGAGEAGAGYFGESVALSTDGSTALCGAPHASPSFTHGIGEQGSAYIFTRSGSTWTQQAELKLTGSAATEELEAGGVALLGASVALSSEGNTALVGAPGYGFDQGAGFVFTRSGSNWTQQGRKLVGAGESGEAVFGASVALSADGDTALIGGQQDHGHLGAAWVFTRLGSEWAQQGEKLTGIGESGIGAFGSSVALSTDGNTALIGARFDDASQGAAWLFTRAGSTWTQQGEKFVGTGLAGAANFGESVALASNGARALIGGQADGDYAGAAWMFAQAGSPSPTGETSTTGQPMTIEPGSSTIAHARITIERARVTATGLLITVKTSRQGAVTLSGDGLKKLVRTLRAGEHRLRLVLTQAGETLRERAETIKLSADLTTAENAVSRATRDIRL